MMGFSGGGRALNRKTKTLTLKVLSRPDTYPTSTWLPAQKLEIQESWSTPPDQLRTGESATRTITTLGEGLQGAQLPPTLFPATEGLKYYPDQPVIGESESSSGLTGSRKDSAALIPTREGSWTIPEVRIPWWDTKAEKVRYAVLPERQIKVTTGTDFQLDSSPIAIVGAADIPSPAAVVAPVIVDDGAWKIAAALSTLGWLLTLLYLIFSRKRPSAPQAEKTENLSEKKAFKQLIAACSADNAVFARRGLIDWADALSPEQGIHSLEEVAGYFHDSELRGNLVKLNNQLYSETGTNWDSGELSNIVQRLRKHQRATANQSSETLALYPS